MHPVTLMCDSYGLLIHTLSEITCPPVRPLPRQRARPIDYDSDPDDNGNYPFETEATFECRCEYDLRGPEYNVCWGTAESSIGVFVPSRPSCRCEFHCVYMQPTLTFNSQCHPFSDEQLNWLVTNCQLVFCTNLVLGFNMTQMLT